MSSLRIEFVDKEQENLTLHRGEIDYQDVILQNLVECTVHLLDVSSSVTIDNVRDCSIFIGPTVKQCHIQNSKDSSISIAASRLFLSSCTSLTLFVYAQWGPRMEECSNIKLSTYNFAYPQQNSHFLSAMFNPEENNWSKVKDISGESYDLLPEHLYKEEIFHVENQNKPENPVAKDFKQSESFVLSHFDRTINPDISFQAGSATLNYFYRKKLGYIGLSNAMHDLPQDYIDNGLKAIGEIAEEFAGIETECILTAFGALVVFFLVFLFFMFLYLVGGQNYTGYAFNVFFLISWIVFIAAIVYMKRKREIRRAEARIKDVLKELNAKNYGRMQVRFVANIYSVQVCINE